jgi:methyl-accepting chemotaxis protein
VRDLTDAAQRIGDVVGLIHSIANQTNLLALNATIEAARAGDSGKGFAVVASEVKNLATQTAKATDDIAAQIGAMQTSTQQAVAAIGGISGVVEQMDRIASGIYSAVEQQRSTAQEIARGVQEAAAGTQEVSRNIAGVSEAAQASGRAANDVLGVAHELSTQATTLRAATDGFLGTMRAA